jgi:hypothetical protein
MTVIEPERVTVAYSSEDPARHLDIEQALTDLRDLRAAQATLRMWDHLLSEWVADFLGRNEIDVDGVGHVQVRHGAVRKAWDHPALTRLVLARARDERIVTADGEYEDVGEAAVRVLTDCAHIDYWRVGKLRERGVDPDEYVETTPGRVSVVIT